MRRNYPDFVEAMSSAIPGRTSPASFRTWVAVASISAVLQRRVWFDHGDWQARPNLYISLIAPPAHGKGVSMTLPFDLVYKKLLEPLVEKEDVRLEAESVWKRYIRQELDLPRHMLSGRTTYEKLCRMMTRLSYNVNGALNKDGEIVDDFPDASILVKSAEFGVFMSRHDKNLHMLLTEAWDSSATHEYFTKHFGEDIIKGPTITWLSGATPAQFVEHMPANAGTQGLLSRIIPVVEMSAPSVTELEVAPYDPLAIENFAQDLGQIAEIKGQFTFSQGAREAVQFWLDGGQEPVPTELMMREYNGRRYSHLLKISMCYSAGRRSTRLITEEDWGSALTLLLDAERKAPQVLHMFGMNDVGKLSIELIDMVQKNGGTNIRSLKRHAIRMSRNVSDITNTIGMLLETKALKQDGDLISMGYGI